MLDLSIHLEPLPFCSTPVDSFEAIVATMAPSEALVAAVVTA
jgi:hypothetical protein